MLKESIPELSRPRDDHEKEQDSKGGLGSSSKALMLGLGSNGNGNGNVDVGVTRLNGVDDMCRSRGIVDLSFCGNGNGNGSDNNDSSGTFRFRCCALRTNGSLEQWEGFSFAPNQSKNDKLCGGTYTHKNVYVHNVRNIFPASLQIPAF